MNTADPTWLWRLKLALNGMKTDKIFVEYDDLSLLIGGFEEQKERLEEMNIDARERATIMAALRYYQQRIEAGAQPLIDIATDSGLTTPLSSDEIDFLCEKVDNAND